MLKNFFLIAFRNLNKNKGYTVLNILGLAAGLTCFAFIAIWIQDELSYDKFNTKADRIVRIYGRVSTASETFEHACSPVPLAKAIKEDYPEVENTVRFELDDAVVKLGNRQFSEDGILLTDPSFFDVFDYHLIQGNTKEALNQPYSIILTQSMAKKYFGDENPIGKILSLSLYDTTKKGMPYTITGLMPDAPTNAHFTFKFLVSFKTLETANPYSITEDGWGDNSYYTYLLLKDKKDINTLQAKLPAFLQRHLAEKMKQWQMRYDYTLQPLVNIHLGSHLRYEITPTGSWQYIYIFGTVGIFILLIAGINYMNLATARAVQRAKETGVQKVLGAAKIQLVLQHLLEAVFVTFLSLLVAILLTTLLQYPFEQLSGKKLSLFTSHGLIIFLIAVSLLLGLLSGMYPAFLITAYKPVEVLKGKLKATTAGIWLRRSLVIVQFTISVVLIIGILVINSQLSFIRHKDLGYKKDALLIIQTDDPAVNNGYAAFRNNLLNSPMVNGVAASNRLIVGGLGNSGASTISGNGKPVNSSIYNLRVGQDFIHVYGMKIIAGRDFYSDIITDSLSYIVNESAVRAFGWAKVEDAINKPFSMNGRNGKVVGVVKDFHFNSLQHAVEPMVIVPRFQRNRFSQITVNINMNKPKEAINWIEQNWKKNFPGTLFQYDFMDKKLGEQYKEEERFWQFFIYFSVLSLLIACLGLFGLTAYTTQQRVKEIGIRKVLGASVTNITTMLSKDFLKLVLVAAILAFPIAWLGMQKWLQNFAYRIDLSWWMFVTAAAIALLIALITISFQAIKAALSNPAKSLRAE